VGKAVNDAMRDIEKHNPQLAGVLPKTYNLFTSTLLKELLKKVSEIPATLDYDAFGRIYEYFLGEFAMTEGQGEANFTLRPPSLASSPKSLSRIMAAYLTPRVVQVACSSHRRALCPSTRKTRRRNFLFTASRKPTKPDASAA
jgi:type I restriction enzyme M protein